MNLIDTRQLWKKTFRRILLRREILVLFMIKRLTFPRSSSRQQMLPGMRSRARISIVMIFETIRNIIMY